MAIVGCPLFGSRYLRSAMNVQFHARPRFMNHPSWSHITTTIRVITSDTTTFRVTPSQVFIIVYPLIWCNRFWPIQVHPSSEIQQICCQRLQGATWRNGAAACRMAPRPWAKASSMVRDSPARCIWGIGCANRGWFTLELEDCHPTSQNRTIY